MSAVSRETLVVKASYVLVPENDRQVVVPDRVVVIDGDRIGK